ncbi:MAG: hypothetical protein QOG32_1634 [Chloroflexota bacterium]|jgi:hypothetical protein|nr:hypothetical protein [Chloroflexota bacterium]
MSVDEKQLAPPKLYGAPAYARPPVAVQPAVRPFDPDELPIEADQTEAERQLAASLRGRAWAADGVHLGETVSNEGAAPGRGLRPRRFSLRAMAGRLLGGD